MRYSILVVVTVFFLAACRDKQQKQDGNPGAARSATGPAADSAAIRGLITDFYSWYSVNYEKLMGYQLYSGIEKPDQPPYRINWDVVEKYQAFIRDSVPQLGAGFLVNQRNMFRQCDSVFKADTEDELPYGFDYDWYTNSQEDPSYLLDGIKASGKWVINVTGDAASVEIGTPEDRNFIPGALLLFVGLNKENGQWKITRIGND